MESFKVFMEQEEFVQFILNEFNGSLNVTPTPTVHKNWSAKKPEILQMWKNLQPNLPIIMTPIMDDPTSNQHSTYGEDGIRITGSWNFISAVIARFKDILNYENNQNKLRLVFRGVDKSKNHRMDRQSYVFYCNLETRKANTKPQTLMPQA